MNKLVLAGVVILAAGYIGVGGWVTAHILGSTLQVGAPTAQGSGWPTPEAPTDIGYAGDPRQAFGYGFTDIALQTDIGVAPAWLVPPADGAQPVRAGRSLCMALVDAGRMAIAFCRCCTRPVCRYCC